MGINYCACVILFITKLDRLPLILLEEMYNISIQINNKKIIRLFYS